MSAKRSLGSLSTDELKALLKKTEGAIAKKQLCVLETNFELDELTERLSAVKSTLQDRFNDEMDELMRDED